MSSVQLNGGVNTNEAAKIQTTSMNTLETATAKTNTTVLNTSNQSTLTTIAFDNAENVATKTEEPEQVEEEGYRLLKYPKGKSCFAQFTWIIIWPIHVLFRIAIPDCKKAKNNKIFPLTFIMCIVWIGSLSYVVAWMITIIGNTDCCSIN